MMTMMMMMMMMMVEHICAICMASTWILRVSLRPSPQGGDLWTRFASVAATRMEVECHQTMEVIIKDSCSM